MSQILVTGEAKIRDIQGPVVANSGVITALNGAANQYVRGDGTLASFPTSGGGGSSVSYYLNGSVNQGTFGGSTYYQMSKNAIVGTGTNFSASANGLIAQFITDVNDPDVVSIPSGNWNVEFFMNVSASSGALASFYVEFYKYNGSTFTLLATNVATPEQLTNTTTVDAYYTSVAMPLSTMAVTDRLAIRIFVNVAGKTVTLYTEDNRLCQVVTTFSKGLASLNNLTDQSQYLTTGTSGTNFNIVSSGDTHTFNLPVASATNTGKLSNTDWSTFNNKLSTATAAATYVPYTGATTSVDLGFNNFDANQINGFKIVAKLDGTGSSPLILRTGTSGYSYGNDSISLISSPTTANTLIITSDVSSVTKIAQFGLGSLTATRTFTLPDTSGTLALTSNLSSYVPYTGATTNVDLGIYNIFSSFVYAEGAGGSTNGGILIKQYSGALAANSGYTSLFATPNQLGINFSGVYNTFLQSGTLTASRTYTLPDLSGTLALLEGSQTFTGLKTFSNNVNINQQLFINGGTGYGGGISYRQGGILSTSDGSTTTEFPDANSIKYYVGQGSNTYKNFVFDVNNITLNATRTYSLPDASGTIALTSDLSGYVTLATNQTITANKTFSEFGFFDKGVLIKQGNYPASSGYNGIGALSGGFYFGMGQTSVHSLNFSTSNSYNYTFPNATGTIALTSNLSAYLPLTGGTLTGALNGTSATFSSTTTATAFIPSGSTIPTNGMYLSAANTLNFATNSLNRFTIASDGIATFGTDLYVNRNIYVNNAEGGVYADFYGRNSTSTSTPLAFLYGSAGTVTWNNGGTKMTLTSAGALQLVSSISATSATLNGNVIINSTATALSPLQVVATGTIVRLGEQSGTTGKQFLIGIDATSGRSELQSVWQGTAFTSLALQPSGGNVAIGNTSASNKLHITGNTSNAVAVQFNGGYSEQGGLGGDNSVVWIGSGGTSFTNNGLFVSGSSSLLYFNTNGAERMRITSSGEILVSGTYNPYAFANRGNITMNGTNSNIIAFTNGSAVRGHIFHNQTDMEILNKANGTMTFWTNDTERMRITSAGLVGINTNSPFNFGSGSGMLDVRSQNTTAISGVFVSNSSASARMAMYMNPAAAGNFGTATNHDLNIYTNDISRMLITSGGTRIFNNEGGGTTNTFNVTPYSSGNALSNKVSTTAGWDHFYFQNPNGNVGVISTNGSSTTYATSSDYRLKEDLKDFDGLDILSKIKFYDFAWKCDNTRTIGVIAHELQSIVPYAVNGEKDAVDAEGNIKSQGVDYSKLVAIQGKAIQQLQAQIEELKALINK